VQASAIELNGVRKVYGDRTPGGETVALSDITLTLAPGAFVSLIGPSGCGKSTLLRIAAGLEAPDEGEVRVHGVTPDEAAAAKLIGFVPQSPALLPWRSVLGNVTLPQNVNRGAARRRERFRDLASREGGRGAAGRGPAEARSYTRELLRKAGLGDVEDKLPGQLSGGMQQRVAIVRALGLRPDVLLMDEPFSSLDEFTRESLQDQLLSLWEELGITVLFVTHSVAEAVRMSDTVVVMAPRPGRVSATVEIALPRPRDQRMLAARQFHDYEDHVRALLGRAWRAPDVA
jgi:NitT/TauT family transport system ATP-binding protein